jgi:signal transduction histidine kinase
LTYEQTQQIQANSDIIYKFIRISKHSSDLLLALVEDVLNLAKMESNLFTVNITEFDLSKLILEVADMFECQCQRKNIKLIIEFD